MLLSRSTLAGIAATFALGGSCVGDDQQTARSAPVRIVPLPELREPTKQPVLRLRSFQGSPATVDRHGIIRDLMGRPVGVWGIEISPLKEVRVESPSAPMPR